MATTYRITFTARRGVGSVDVTVPDATEPVEYIAREIARELDLMRFEVQIGDESGHIRRLGDDGPGTPFSFTALDRKAS